MLSLFHATHQSLPTVAVPISLFLFSDQVHHGHQQSPHHSSGHRRGSRQERVER